MDENEQTHMKFFKIIFWMFIAVISALALIACIVAFVLLSLPQVTELKGCLTTNMYKVKLCAGGEHYAYLKDIAPIAVDAVIASEDTSFYSHNGFDWYEIQQSMNANLADLKIHRGGSTITQQLAKNIWLSKEKSFFRKAKEAYLTYQLEKNFDKKFIIEKYLNVVQFGLDLYGIKDAARFYFKKSPSNLNVLESVYLAFLLPNPELYSRGFKKGQLTPFAKNIVSRLLNRLATFKKITPGEYQFAVSKIDNFPWAGISNEEFAVAARAEAPAVEAKPEEPLPEEAAPEDGSPEPAEEPPSI